MADLPALRQLEYLVAVADTGLFVEAAKRCNVSQPALSKQVREVEELLGIEIFERTRPRVLVTPVGEEVIRRARKLVAEARELVESARASTREGVGTVRLGVIPTVAPYGLPGLLAKLRALFPAARFILHELQTDALIDQLRNGGIDLGLLARSFDDSGLMGRDLVFEPFALVAPSGHFLARARGVNAKELGGESLLLMEDGHCLRDQAIDVCTSAGASPDASIAAGSIATLVRMVESGLGATLVPVSALRTELGEGLVARAFNDPVPGRKLTLQWRVSSASSRWFARIGHVLQEHYLSLNDGIPDMPAGKPEISALDS